MACWGDAPGRELLIQVRGRRLPLAHPGGELRPGTEPQLLQDSPDVGGGRVLRDHQLRGYLAVGETSCHEGRYLLLAAGEGSCLGTCRRLLRYSVRGQASLLFGEGVL